MASRALRLRSATPVAASQSAPTRVWPVRSRGAARSAGCRPAVVVALSRLMRSSRSAASVVSTRLLGTLVRVMDRLPPAALGSPPRAEKLPSSCRSRLARTVRLPPLLATVCRCTTVAPAVWRLTSSVPTVPSARSCAPCCSTRLVGAAVAASSVMRPPSCTVPWRRPLAEGVSSVLPLTSITLRPPSHRYCALS